MRIDIGNQPAAYLSGIATLALSVFACYTAAAIGTGPVCLLLYFLALLSLGLGISLVVGCFIASGQAHERQLRANAARRTVTTAVPPRS